MAAALDTSNSGILKIETRVCATKKSNHYASSWLRTVCSSL
jgi:hypothetical protein